MSRVGVSGGPAVERRCNARRKRLGRPPELAHEEQRTHRDPGEVARVLHDDDAPEREIAVPTKIFVNLPVKDLNRSKQFYTALGYAFNPQFTDEKAGCLVISEHIYAMLLVEPYFKTFTKKHVADATTSIEAIIALSADSKEEVDQLANQAEAAGSPAMETRDHGFMYQRGFQDPDGHVWEVFWMDPSSIQ
jgi:predicted lactoylglutathione lyase